MKKYAQKKRSIRTNLNIALVHDYLREYGGAERVLEALHELYPHAPVYVAFIDWQALGVHAERFKNWDIRQTWLARVPFIHHIYSPLRILADRAFRSLDLSEYDVVISSSNAYFAKAVRVPHGVHICYCHTPPRALYGYSTMTNWKANPVTHFIGTLINHYCRIVDFNMAQKVDFFIANSHEIARRIKKFYRRESTVIYPPVGLDVSNRETFATRPSPHLSAFPPSQNPSKEYYLYVNRLAFAKHPEIAVAAANKLKLFLDVVGAGPMFPQLQEIAGPTIGFLGQVDDQKLYELYAGAKAILYPVEDEDFGIVPVEAMQLGVPVIAHRSGGPMETIIDGKNGVFFDELSVDGLVRAIKKFQTMKFDKKAMIREGRKYTKEQFQRQIAQFVNRTSAKIRKK